MKTNIQICILMFLPGFMLRSQDISTLRNQKPIDFKGAVQLQGGFYATPDADAARRSPYNWSISGSPTLILYGWSIPVTFTYQQQRFSYSQPFQRIGTSPRWKWLTLHAGYRNMTFSPYTLAGHTFLGGGLEINRKKFQLAMMGGNLQNALIQSDTIVLGSRFLDTYTRRAYGLKLGFGGLKNRIAFHVLQVKDLIGTDQLPSELKVTLPASENMAGGMDMRFTFFKHFILEGTGAMSVFTRDAQFLDFDSIESKLLREAKAFGENFMRINLSTRVGLAGDASARLQFARWHLGVKYQRIEPFYTTLGAYYMQDDIENRTVTGSLKLLKGKLNFSGSVGLQRNNLQGFRSLSAQRVIGNSNLNWLITKSFGVNAQYSNFRAEQQQGFQNIVDTIRFVQVNQMWNLSPYYHLNTKNVGHFIQGNASLQIFDDLSGSITNISQSSSSKTIFASYRHQRKRTGWAFTVSANYFQFLIQEIKSNRYGATLGLGKSMLKKKLDLNLSTTYNIAEQPGLSGTGFVMNNSLSAAYRLQKNQSLHLRLYQLTRDIPQQNNYSEFSGNLGYSFRF